ncbi:hypothetical protein L6278_03115 [Candidatus Parcubacteria bacterium]|nr:hypothetical protein [Candidatus Parcubacteria bacterium]
MNKNKDIIQNSLKLVKNCPVCRTKYTIPMADVVQELETGYLVYFSCANCKSSLLTQISEMPFGLIGSAMLTDLELNEVLKFKNGEKVTVDDVLEVYESLEKERN